MSIRREFRLPNSMSFEFGADVMNLLNNAQFNGA